MAPKKEGKQPFCGHPLKLKVGAGIHSEIYYYFSVPFHHSEERKSAWGERDGVGILKCIEKNTKV